MEGRFRAEHSETRPERPRARTRALALDAIARDGRALIHRADSANIANRANLPHVPTATPVPTRVLCFNPSRATRTRAGKFVFFNCCSRLPENFATARFDSVSAVSTMIHSCR